MLPPDLGRVLRRALAFALLTGACVGGANQADAESATASAGSVASSSAPAADRAADRAAPITLTAADLDGYVRGIGHEAVLVRAARERGRAATTPGERGGAAQAEWEDATIPGGARAAGLPAARYRQVRATVHRVLQTLDFQGKIDGPQELDPSSASPEMRRRLDADPFAELASASASVLRGRLPQVVAAYLSYVELTAVHG